MNPILRIAQWVVGQFSTPAPATPAPMPAGKGRRAYAAAVQSRLTSDWQTTQSSADTEINGSAKILRDRSRQQERDNPYIRRWLALLENNVIGSNGIGLQMKVRNLPTKQDPKGPLDTLANDLIEEAWWQFGRKDSYTPQKTMSMATADRVGLRSLARDGGFLIRHVRGKDAKNRWNYAVEFFEIDQLDHDFNQQLPGGGYVRMGVEYAASGMVAAYHLLTTHPGDQFIGMRERAKYRQRIPAREMELIYRMERFGQSVGVPWNTTVALAIQMLNGYQEAELVAARSAACKEGFIEQQFPDGTGPDPDSIADGQNLFDMEPGVVRALDPGQKFITHDPTHPNSAFPAYVQAQLRTIASGLGVSYNTLANDLVGVNYSSIRAGLLEDREEYKSVQEFWIDAVKTPIFEAWLEMALMSEALGRPGMAPLPFSRFDKFNRPEWKARRWPWVDPLNDIQAAKEAINLRVSSRRQIISEGGGDVENVFRDNSEDELLAESMGLDLTPEETAKAEAIAASRPPAADTGDSATTTTEQP